MPFKVMLSMIAYELFLPLRFGLQLRASLDLWYISKKYK